MRTLWEDDEGKYARVHGIKLCSWRANILPYDINNDVGVPISMNNINKNDCDNICNWIETLSLKVKESGVNVFQDAHDLKVSLVSDGSFTKSKIMTMAENCVQVEYDPYIIDAAVDEAI